MYLQIIVDSFLKKEKFVHNFEPKLNDKLCMMIIVGACKGDMDLSMGLA